MYSDGWYIPGLGYTIVTMESDMNVHLRDNIRVFSTKQSEHIPQVEFLNSMLGMTPQDICEQK